MLATLPLNYSGVHLALSGFLEGRFCAVSELSFGFSFCFSDLFTSSEVAPILGLEISVFTGFSGVAS
jgi:hypothetical protein